MLRQFYKASFVFKLIWKNVKILVCWEPNLQSEQIYSTRFEYTALARFEYKINWF